ncbi:hypothetical protein [Klebsiella quasipneumoniae]|uniref:hypothetical protein n=1 Tax=Klebsiella quasipneumoniae TaxID=1463165 RepID=UPI0021C37166|nr:hypothetical protein [Klebsiella quasipneumoniae]
MTIINNFLCANGKIMKKTLLIAAIVAAGITFAMADDGQPAGRLYKIGEHTVEIDADCMILSVDGSPATLNASVSGHMDFNLANGGIAESEPRPNRHTCKVYAGSDVRTIHIKEPRQPGGCKLKTAPVRPVVAARPAEYVCSEDLFY